MQVSKMRPRKIKEATNDRIVLVDGAVTPKCIFWSLVLIAVASFFLLCLVSGLTEPEYSGERLEQLIFFVFVYGFMFMCCGGGRSPGVLHDLLIKESVVIDRNLQSVVIEGDSFIKYLESTKKIRFSDMEYIEVTIDALDGRATGHRDVRLITFHGTGVKIYDGDCETAEKIGKKIQDITGKQSSHKKHHRTSN
jgi:hypothetical protein